MPLPESKEQALIDTIIEYELEMFQAVNNFGGTANCQERPGSFKAMRWMAHSVFPAEYLESYLKDLKDAKANGINLMTIKYGRMDDLIPPYSTSPLIAMISDVEEAWMQELHVTAPDAFRNVQTEGFRRYLSSELETLSEKTLALYKKYVDEAKSDGRNLVKERYENLRERYGFQGEVAQ